MTRVEERHQKFAIIAFKEDITQIKLLHAALLRSGYGVRKLSSEDLEMLLTHSAIGTLGNVMGFFIVNLPNKDGQIDAKFNDHIIELSKKLKQCNLKFSQEDALREFENSFGALETIDDYGIIARSLISMDADLFEAIIVANKYVT